jgi:septum formation protein
MKLSPALLLASASPRRAQLLLQLGLQFSVQPADIDETPAADEIAGNYVCRMAEEKALAIRQRLSNTELHQQHVLGADTTVVCGDQIMGKPEDALAAVSFLRRLSGRSHQVMSAVCLAGPAATQTLLQISTVTFMPLTDQQISHYVASGEPMGKAGAYAIQGRAAAFIVDLRGSYSCVMGLPLAETARLLRSVDLLTY